MFINIYKRRFMVTKGEYMHIQKILMVSIESSTTGYQIGRVIDT